MHDILTTQSNGVRLITDAWSSVLGPSVLIWLAGHTRLMRPTTHFRFRSLEELLRRRKSTRPPWENDFAAMAGDAEPEVNPMVTNYKTVLRLMDQYLPVDQWAGKTITPDMLRELAVLENSSLDDLLHKCLSGNATPAPAESLKEPWAKSAGDTARRSRKSEIRNPN